MIILVYIDVLFFCYGVYNIICYMSMLPSVHAGRHMKNINCSYSFSIFENTIIMALAGRMVDKWKIDLANMEIIEKAVLYSNRKYGGSIFLISRLFSCFAMLLLCMPTIFYNMKLLLILVCICILLMVLDVSFLVIRYMLYEKSLKKELMNILYLAKRHFKENDDALQFYEVCADKTEGAWRQFFVGLTKATNIRIISSIWTDRWLKLFADGLQNENKSECFEQLYYDFYLERFGKLKTKLEYMTKLAELLSGVLIFCFVIIYITLVYII